MNLEKANEELDKLSAASGDAIFCFSFRYCGNVYQAKMLCLIHLICSGSR